MSFGVGLYDGLASKSKLGLEDKTKTGNKRNIDGTTALIPRSKRVAPNTSAPKPVTKKIIRPPQPPVLNLKDSSGNDLGLIDMESSADINITLSNIEDPYDPSVPNSYEEYRSRKLQATMLEQEQQRLSELVFQQQELQKHQELLQKQRERDEKEKENSGLSGEPNKTEETETQPQPVKKGNFAEMMLKKMGWKGEGHGLGKNQQGMALPLAVQKTGDQHGIIVNTSVLELEKNSVNPTGTPPSRCIVLHNLVGPGEVDDYLTTETSNECEKYGTVMKCEVHESRSEKNPEEAVKLYVKFRYQEHALKALMDIDGRYFGGREVKADYYNELAFDRGDFRLL